MAWGLGFQGVNLGPPKKTQESVFEKCYFVRREKGVGGGRSECAGLFFAAVLLVVSLV
jgi:hypothetical protein